MKIDIFPQRARPNNKRWAIDVAEGCYAKWWTTRKFAEDVADYLVNGAVISRPDMFFMYKVIDLGMDDEGNRIGPPEAAWYVRMAVGNLAHLIAELPALPKIRFERPRDNRMREVSFEQLKKKICAVKRGNNHG